jgi:uncharacterized protein YerC
MTLSQLVINILTKKTIHGLTESEENSCLIFLVNILTDNERKTIIKRLQVQYAESDSK